MIGKQSMFVYSVAASSAILLFVIIYKVDRRVDTWEQAAHEDYSGMRDYVDDRDA